MNQLQIRINGLEGHSVTDDPNPSFTFMKPGDTAADNCSLTVLNPDGRVWNSGIIPFSPHLRYGGPDLQAKTCYMVKACLYYGEKKTAETDASFETGFLGEPWNAAWIEPKQDDAVREDEIQFHKLFMPNPDFFGGHTRLRPCREVKKTIFLDHPLSGARVYASAHGVYELTVNGQAVAGSYFAPETSTYPKMLYYQTYDVTQVLTEGENELKLVLADGWWIGRIGLSGDSCQYGDRLGCIVQADITLADGTKYSIGSDDSFLGRRSRIDYADLFIGQRTDFTLPEEPWSPCLAAEYDMRNLVAQPTAPIAEIGIYQPEWTVSDKGELIADFGQCIAGVADITVRGEEGREVTLDFCEVLDEKGNFLRNILGRNKDQRDVFVCAPGVTEFRPKFTYHGFRYMRIEGLVKEEIIGLKALALGTRLEARGSFSCSDERLSRFQENILQSTRANMFSVPTDCPQREKAGWTGDMLSFAPTGCFNFHLDGFLAAWLANMRLEQFDDGAVPVVVPNYPAQEKMQRGTGGSTSSAWSDACVLVPWSVYRSYGDLRILQENVQMMRRWLAFAAEQCRIIPPNIKDLSGAEQKWNDFLFNKGFHFGDWFIPSFVRHEGGVFAATEATKDVVGSCFHALALDVYLKVLDELKSHSAQNPEIDEERLLIAGRLESVRTAVRECYINSEGIVKGDLQGLYVIALRAGIVEGDLREKLAARLCFLIEANGCRLDTGFVSTPYLLDVLSDNGRTDLAYRLLFQNENPSWLYMVEKGATTIWENWEAVKPDGTSMPSSFNHYALGSVGDFIYRHIGGLIIEGPGYQRLRISPDIHCGLEHAFCEVETSYGTASCRWEWNNNICTLDISVPDGCDAVYAKEGGDLALSGGTYQFRTS